MAFTQAEEDELRAMLAERASKTSARRLFDLEHRRMSRGRGGLTTQENADLDAHLAAREAAADTDTKRGP
jgi:hypothetical protein